jgi:hypothetical protein
MNAPDDQHFRISGRPLPREEDIRLAVGAGPKPAFAAWPGQAA